VRRKIVSFPHIRRVYRLEDGIKRLFGEDSFWAEEKLDGYNVRIFQFNGDLYAATRGGFICPFTTEWARIWAEDEHLDAFFHDFPGHVLCAEVIGDNPYNAERDPDVAEGAHLYVFDICDEQGNFLLTRERYGLIRKYLIPAPPVFGEFSRQDMGRIYELLRDLNSRGREGVVLKSGTDNRVLKFVTPESDLKDIAANLQIGFDLSHGYFFNRYLRASLFVKELGLDQEVYARRIGQTFLQGTPPIEGFSGASETYVIFVLHPGTWDELHDQLKSRLLIACDEISETRLKGRIMQRIVFRRIYQKSSHRYRRILQGYLHQD
jgi:putative ATP-dependent DNA ligase